MKSLRAACGALAILVTVPLFAACADEDAEGRQAAYPIGASIPTGAEPQALPQPPPAEPPPPPGTSALPQAPPPREEVLIGTDDPDAPPAADSVEGQVGPGELPPPYAEPPPDTDPSSLTDFRAALDQYGTWVDDPTYGTVWVPSQSAVGSDFTPYVSDGHWAYDDDYTWVSDYAWGWAPFHYGRWTVGRSGWSWIPGRTYAGAWVSWRYGLDDWAYVGWAPLAPTWCWRRGAAVGLGFAPPERFSFVASGDLFASSVHDRVAGGARAAVIQTHTRPFVAATPAAAGRVFASPQVSGPPPSTLRIPQSAVLRVGSNSGVMQARAFARAQPAAATATRALAPAYGPPVAPRVGSRLGGGGSVAAGTNRSEPFSPYARTSPYRAGPAASTNASHFGGRLGVGFVGSPPAPGSGWIPPSRGYARPYFAPPSAGARAGTAAARPGGAEPGAAVAPAGRSVSPAPAGGSTGVSRGGAGYSSGGRGGSFRGGGGSRSGGRR